MNPFSWHGGVVGLLGGSFNPAHEGHLAVTQHALKKLKLDHVVWLVSPHNPLKEKDSLADYQLRFTSAKAMTEGQRCVSVSDIEQQKQFFYTYQTIDYLTRHFPATQFVWLMGADNLAGFSRWQRWQWLMHKIPIIIFDRVPFSHRSLRSKAAIRGQKMMIKNNQINRSWQAPTLHVVRFKRDPHSSTALRNSLGKGAFLRHNKNTGSL